MAQTRIGILHALGTLNPGGVETWLMHVLRNIDHSRFQMDFCTFGSEPGMYGAEVEKCGSKVWRCPKSANLWSFGHRFRIRAYRSLMRSWIDCYATHGLAASRSAASALFSALPTDQARNSTFPEFLAASWRTGVARCDVDFSARTVSYYGSNREEYVEKYAAVEVG